MRTCIVISANDYPWEVCLSERDVDRAKLECREAMNKKYNQDTSNSIIIHTKEVHLYPERDAMDQHA